MSQRGIDFSDQNLDKVNLGRCSDDFIIAAAVSGLWLSDKPAGKLPRIACHQTSITNERSLIDLFHRVVPDDQ
jgi:hypothetical protein